jgi:predicted PurR-regulated permease PerM
MDSKPLAINLSVGSVVKAILVVLAFWAAFKLQHLVLITLVSVIIASGVEQGTKALARWKIPRLGGVIIIYVAAFAVVFIALSAFLPPLFNDLTDLASGLPAKLDAITQMGTTVDPLSSITGGLARSFTLSDLIVQVQKFILQLSDSVFSTASAIFGGFFSFILILVISFYLSVQERGIENFLRIATPLRYEDYILDLWRRTQKKIGLWFQGQLVLGILVGLTVFVGLSILGVKYALTLGLLTAVLEIIPFFGPIISAVPGVLLGFAAGPGLGLVVLIFYIVVQQLEAHVVYPLVAKKIIGLPPLMVILALLAGAELYGFLGMVISVPFCTLLMELAGDAEKRKTAKRGAKAGA